ncbi:MAG: tetratricopeptide repeat protein [Candidatus Omnitrophica bacterium]|nr:tetratricopeptide repeat protein [Candidatus Omnitrophota bacterium]
MKALFFRVMILIFLICFCGSTRCYPSKETIFNYNEEGIKNLGNGDYAAAIDSFKKAYYYDPYNKSIKSNLATAYNNYGFYLMNRGELTEAADEFEKAVYYDTSNAYMFYNLGQVYYKLQELEKAKESLDKGYFIDKNIKGLTALRDKISKEIGIEADYSVSETLHFIISFPTGIDPAKIMYIRGYLEEAYGKIGKFIGFYPSEKIAVIIYTEEDFMKTSDNSPYWAVAFYDGKIRLPMDKSRYTRDDIVKIIYHEYAHVIIRYLTGNKCPVWFSEGFAAKSEDLGGFTHNSDVLDYIKNFGIVSINEFPDSFSTIKDKNKAVHFYAQAYMFMDYFVNTCGTEGLLRVLKFLSQNIPITDALSDVLGIKSSQLEENFGKYLKDRYNIIINEK